MVIFLSRGKKKKYSRVTRRVLHQFSQYEYLEIMLYYKYIEHI